MKQIFKNQKNSVLSLGMLFAGIVTLVVFMQGCSKEDDIYGDADLSTISINRESEEFGRQMASNLRHVVTLMNNNGDDFSDLTKIKASVLKYYPQHMPVQSLNGEGFDIMNRGKYHYTPVQMIFLEKIKNAQTKSCTAQEFMQHLKEIINEIQATVPKIQQRNLLKATTALYYLTKETDLLLKEGLIPVNLKQPQHIRLRSGNNEANTFWASLWAGACVMTDAVGAELLAILEGMASVAGASLMVLGSCLLLTGDTENSGEAYCLKKFEQCYSPIPDGCGICLQFCRVQGYWPPVSTHQCH